MPSIADYIKALHALVERVRSLSLDEVYPEFEAAEALLQGDASEDSAPEAEL